jgi:hypothetical protein
LAELGGSTPDSSAMDAMFGEWDAFDQDDDTPKKDTP